MRVMGEKELLRNLSDFSKRKVHDIYQASAAIQGMVSNEAKRNAPVDTGNLAKSILPGRVEVTNTDVRAEVVAETEYASYVEFGTSPHWPPIDRMKLWAERKLGDEGLGFVVARAISKRGTRPRPFLGPALLSHMTKFANAIKKAMRA